MCYMLPEQTKWAKPPCCIPSSLQCTGKIRKIERMLLDVIKHHASKINANLFMTCWSRLKSLYIFRFWFSSLSASHNLSGTCFASITTPCPFWGPCFHSNYACVNYIYCMSVSSTTCCILWLSQAPSGAAWRLKDVAVSLQSNCTVSQYKITHTSTH